MTNKVIAKMLDLHSVPYYEEKGHIYADSMISRLDLWDQVIDLTNYTRRQLLDWLGYDEYNT